MRRFVTVALVVCALAGSARAASAQAFGVRAGVSGSPDQFYFGVHMQTAPVFDQVRFRPNVEMGFGQDERLLALNFELVYRAPIRRQPWSILVGGGPAANIAMHDRPGGTVTNTGGGLNILIGLEHRDGFFTELRVGLIDSPGVKFGIGYTFR